jgi:hypothetical protein
MLLGARTPERSDPSGVFNSGLQVELHAAVPMGALASDINDQLGFGLGLGYRAQLGSHLALRAAFRWTGYRISDRNLGARLLATLADSNYEEDRLILRSYSLGGDLMVYREEGCQGPYVLAGGGLQRSRMYLEYRTVDPEGNERLEDLAIWPAANTPFWNFGLGYQSRSPFFIEGRVTLWRYRAEPGVRLMQTSLNAASQFRDAISFVAAIGVQF